ncbi:hypothetical protein FOZ62_018731, partial [Perkinsus olseni]
MDDLYQCRGFLIGTSNSLLLSHRTLQAHIIVDMDKRTVVTNKIGGVDDAGKELMKYLKLDKDEKKLMKTLHGLTDDVHRLIHTSRRTRRRHHKGSSSSSSPSSSSSSSILGSYVHERSN